MAKVISVHEYRLKAGVDERQFQQAAREARERGLFDLPGLVEHHFVRRIRGTGGPGAPGLAAIWVYENRDAWQRLWGPVCQPVPKEAYPEQWKVWEDELLRPLLDREPDKITMAAYEEFL